MARSGSLDGLIKWSGREEWLDLFEEVVDDHYGAVCEDWGIELDFEKFAEMLGDDVSNLLWSCAFEDFVTRVDPKGERTVVDDYLKRRGWKESASNRRYMEALRDSIPSLYAASDVLPGESLLARDLIRGGDPVRVSDHAASRFLREGNLFAARLVEVAGRNRFSGTFLPFQHELALELLDEIQSERESFREAGEALLARAEARETVSDGEPDGSLAAQDDELMESLFMFTAAPMFTSLWLDDALAEALGEVPDGFNEDGDPIVHHTLRFAFRENVVAGDIRQRLRAVPAFNEVTPDRWEWLQLGDGAASLGAITLGADMLHVSVNSESRAGLARAMLFDQAGDLLGAPDVEVGEAPDGEVGEAADGEARGS